MHSRISESLTTGLANFEDNRAFEALRKDQYSRTQYRNLLLMLFHQTFNGPSAFALAGGLSSPDDHEWRDYLLAHAAEEASHWKWILEDLEACGYKGEDPRLSLPPAETADYIALNYFVSLRCPPARLGIALFLESVGPRFGQTYIPMLAKQAEVDHSAMKFFASHTVTDADHEQTLVSLISNRDFEESEMKWFVFAIENAARLYKTIWDSSVQ